MLCGRYLCILRYLLLCTATAVPLGGFDKLGTTSPSLLCIGVGKSGTTDMFYRLLARFPKMFNQPTTKEPYGLLTPDLNVNQTAQSSYKLELNVSGPFPHTLDFNPLYFRALPAADMAKQMLPGGAHVLIMMRNPVDLLLSSVNWHLKSQVERFGDSAFQEFDPNLSLMLELELMLQPDVYLNVLNAVKQGGAQGFAALLETCNMLGSMMVHNLGESKARMSSYLMFGIYAPALSMWEEIFLRPHRTLVVLSDAYFQDADKVIEEALVPFVLGTQNSPSRRRTLLHANTSTAHARLLNSAYNVDPGLTLGQQSSASHSLPNSQDASSASNPSSLAASKGVNAGDAAGVHGFALHRLVRQQVQHFLTLDSSIQPGVARQGNVTQQRRLSRRVLQATSRSGIDKSAAEVEDASALLGSTDGEDSNSPGATHGPVINKNRRKKHISRGLYCALHTFYQPFNCMLAHYLTAYQHKITVYPPDRLQGIGCNLWGEQSRLTASCNMPKYTQLIQDFLAAPAR